MFNNPYSNNNCRISNSILVDKAFGESYHIVKEVYNNLNIFKEIIEDNSLDFIVENYNELIELKPYIVKTIENIININIIASNINSINTVSSDLKGELITDLSKDLGMIGEDSEGGNLVVTGGNIKKVADDIESVRIDAENIEDIKLVADNLEDLPSITEGLEDKIETVQDILDNINIAIDNAEDIISQVTAEGTKQVNIIKQESNSAIFTIDSKINTVTSLVEDAKEYSEVASTMATNASSSAKTAELEVNKAKEYKESALTSKEIAAQQANIASDKANQATLSEASSKSWATKSENSANASKNSETTTKTYLDEVISLAQNVKEIDINLREDTKDILSYTNQIKVVGDNINSVITTANNIEDISLIVGDLQGSFEIGDVIDYGNLDDPNSDSTVITGGNIYIVAQNIDAVKKVAENIDNLPNPGEPGDVDLSNYYTKEETDNKIAKAIESIPSGGSNNAYDIIYGESNVGAILDDLLYVAIAITSFTSNVGNQEKGSVVNNVTLSWNYNKLPETLTLNNESLDVSSKSKSLTNQNITSNKTWTLKATDSRGAVSQKNVSISFLNGVYYGIGSITESSGITNEFIQGLTKVLASSRNRTFSVNAGTGQYIYYAIPVVMGKPTFYVGGFEGGFDLLHTFLYTNSKGYSENYYVYKSTNSSLGSTSVEVK